MGKCEVKLIFIYWSIFATCTGLFGLPLLLNNSTSPLVSILSLMLLKTILLPGVRACFSTNLGKSPIIIDSYVSILKPLISSYDIGPNSSDIYNYIWSEDVTVESFWIVYDIDNLHMVESKLTESIVNFLQGFFGVVGQIELTRGIIPSKLTMQGGIKLSIIGIVVE